jgi:hypothetical protein
MARTRVTQAATTIAFPTHVGSFNMVSGYLETTSLSLRGRGNNQPNSDFAFIGGSPSSCRPRAASVPSFGHCLVRRRTAL